MNSSSNDTTSLAWNDLGNRGLNQVQGHVAAHVDSMHVLVDLGRVIAVRGSFNSDR